MVIFVSIFILDMFGNGTKKGRCPRKKTAHSIDPLKLIV